MNNMRNRDIEFLADSNGISQIMRQVEIRMFLCDKLCGKLAMYVITNPRDRILTSL